MFYIFLKYKVICLKVQGFKNFILITTKKLKPNTVLNMRLKEKIKKKHFKN